MASVLQAVAESQWVKGDYRYAASLDDSLISLTDLAARVGATPHSFTEPGLGEGHSFGVRMESGRQVAFEQYKQGKGLNVLLLFEGGSLSRNELEEVLSHFSVPRSLVVWTAPELK